MTRLCISRASFCLLTSTVLLKQAFDLTATFASHRSILTDEARPKLLQVGVDVLVESLRSTQSGRCHRLLLRLDSKHGNAARDWRAYLPKHSNDDAKEAAQFGHTRILLGPRNESQRES